MRELECYTTEKFKNRFLGITTFSEYFGCADISAED
jgi:hypothetical protein